MDNLFSIMLYLPSPNVLLGRVDFTKPDFAHAYINM